MRVVLFGATGMVGQGVLRECLFDPEVGHVLAVGRRATGQRHEKLSEIERADLFELSGVDFAGYDACFFCLGVSSAGMAESEYRRITYDLTLSAARTLIGQSPGMSFVYVSGMGTDSTERGRIMWARVKGATENALLRMPFKAVYAFRPAYIHPGPGITARTAWTRRAYRVMTPLYPVLRRLFPKQVTTTERLGRAMIEVVRRGPGRGVLESIDIDRLGAAAGPRS